MYNFGNLCIFGGMAERDHELTLKQAAARLRLTPGGLRKRSSEEPHPKKVLCTRTVGGHRRYNVKVIDEWRLLLGYEGPIMRDEPEPPPPESYDDRDDGQTTVFDHL